MRIYHLATKADWEQAQETGAYTTSTRGRTLAEEGFLHASREDQWRGVLERYYRGVEAELLLLEIDTDRLEAPWREDPVGDDTFPHVYGPLNPDAVVSATPVSDR